MTCYVKLICTSTTITTRHPTSENRWDRGDTTTSWHVQSAELHEEHVYNSVPFPGKLTPGDIVHCVYAIWSTGDSFGNDDNKRLELLAAYTDPKKAVECVKAHEGNDQTYILEDGTEMEIHYRPWSGYFESLTTISIHTAILQIGQKDRF